MIKRPIHSPTVGQFFIHLETKLVYQFVCIMRSEEELKGEDNLGFLITQPNKSFKAAQVNFKRHLKDGNVDPIAEALYFNKYNGNLIFIPPSEKYKLRIGSVAVPMEKGIIPDAFRIEHGLVRSVTFNDYYIEEHMATTSYKVEGNPTWRKFVKEKGSVIIAGEHFPITKGHYNSGLQSKITVVLEVLFAISQNNCPFQ